ncbi:unnamed protein product [Adineta steineri]|uniref:Dynein heavy chain ATP-binding dynein motor region domain-containing protein n=1 Tax=Adineta steineri TaxID=433720 RepID=A0A813Z577_9BILA|nr:unnamed protein product [Adineta steineri]CAF0893938.1 unnamed protein product [Adineta steineri]CAF0963560.1 unnamed protein product [Adineta steineri]
MHYEWLSNGVLPSEMENHTIIIKSIEYPPLLIDPFGQYDQWMKKYYNLPKIYFDNQSKDDVVMSIEQSFLSRSKIYINNCNTLDSVLYSLAQWKATSQESNSNADLIWFELLSLPNLFNQDDQLHHLSEPISENDQQWKNWYDNPQLNLFHNLNNQQFSQIEK